MDNNVIAKHILDVSVGLEKKSKAELVAELSDIFDNASKIDLNSKENINSLKNLAKAFEAIFSKAGDKSINFEDIIKMPPPAMFAEMGKIAATSFWDAWNSVSKGMADNATAGLEETLKKLKLEQADLKRERTKIQAEINKKASNKEKADSLIDFDDKTVKSLKVEGDVIQKAKEMYSDLHNVAKQLNDIGKEQGQDSQEYIKALYEAQDIYHNLYRMRKTLQKLEKPAPQSVRAAYGLFEDYGEQVRYEEAAEKAGKKPVLPFYETNAGEFIGGRWERFAGAINKSQNQLNAVDGRLSEIDAQISEITKSIQASGGAVGTVVQNASNGLKTLNEIKAVYDKLRVDGEKRIDKREITSITSALEFKPNESSKGIQSFYSQYQQAAESGDWVEEYKALLKYVRLYESYLTTTNKTHSNKITKKGNPFTDLYEQLKPMADNAQNMLQNILNMGEGKQLVGMGGTGGDGSGSGPTPEDVANAQKLSKEAEAKAKAEKEAREEAEKRLQAEREIEESKKKQRIEEEKLAKAAEKKKAADQAASDANLKASEETVASRKEELGLAKAMDKFNAEFEKTDKKNETLAFMNSKTGDMSELFIGDAHGVTMDPGTSRKMSQSGFDMEVHSHSWRTAAPSVEDFESWFQQLQYIQKFGIRAGEELLAFDFSKLSPADLMDVIDQYKELDKKINDYVKNLSFDGKEALSLEHGSLDDSIQVFLRRGLEKIVTTQFPGVMSSMKMPDLPIDRMQAHAKPAAFVDVWARASEEVKALIKELAILDHQIDEIGNKGGDAPELVKRADEIFNSLPEGIGQSLTGEDWRRFVKTAAAEADSVTPVDIESSSKGVEDNLKTTIALLEKEKLTYEDILALVKEYNDESKMKELSKAGNWDEYDKIFAHHADIAKKLVPVNMMGMGSDSPDKWLATVGMSAETAAERLKELYDRLHQVASVDDELIGVTESLEKTHQLMPGGGAGGVSSSDFEAERTKAESLQAENDALQDRLQKQADEAADEALRNQEARAELQEQISTTEAELEKANKRAQDAEEKSAMYDDAMRGMKQEMDELQSKFGGDKTVVDNSELEATLTKVFASILNPQTQQNDYEHDQKPWALENTLQAVKAVLDDIRTDTAKIETVGRADSSSDASKSSNKNPYLLTDANGKPLTIYRGTRDSFGGFVASRTGTFGTDNLNIAKGYTHGDGKVYAYNAEMHNPLEIQAKGAQLKQIPNLGNAFEAITDPVLKELRDLLSQISNLKKKLKTATGFEKEVTIPGQIDALQKKIQEISEDESHVYGVGGTDLFARKAKKNGYDGVIFRDLVDPSSATPPSERVPSNIIVTFDESQMHLLETLSVANNEISTNDTQDSTENFDESRETKSSNANGVTQTLENTLQSVKGLLDNIRTADSGIRPAEANNVDTIAGTALDGRLIEIKSVLESIDGKIAKGGVIATRGAVKQANTQPVESEVKAQAARSNMMKSLINDYKTMGKLAAQFASNDDLETKAMLQNLKEEIARKRKSLKLTMDESASLREKYSIAFDAEKRLLDAAKEQEKINKKNKADAKEAENAWKKQVKDAQRATGINAATTTANSGDQTVIRAIGAEGVSKDIENKAKELSNNIKALRVVRDEIDKKGEKASDADKESLSKQIVKVKELKTELDEYLKIHEKYSGDNVVDLGDGIGFGVAGSDQYWNNITAAIKNAATGRVAIKGMNADTGELTGTTKIAANTFVEWSATVDPITHRLTMLRTGIKKTETIIEAITRKTKEIFTYFSGSSMIFKAFNELKKGIQYVREIDLALTELKKVTDATEESYDRFLKTAAKTGARLGATISAVTEATATFAKLGYDMKTAAEMAEAAIVYKNVGDNIASTEDAADSIISTLKGFGMEASEAMAIVDRFNEVGNRFAITSQGIGEALRLSASALNEGGNSIDESIAMITAANEVVNDPSSVGTALKTLTLRLRGAKTELEEMGEDVTGMATTTSQLQSKLLALTGGQVDIMLDENTFKNSTQILREMAAAWEDMNDIQRASALELMGGKRQANVLSALIQNFDTVESAIEASSNSAGSALKENERYLDSIQGKIDQFTNATQSMWNNFLDADVVKFIVDLGTKLIKLIDKIGMIPSVLGGVFVYLTAFKKQNPLSWIQDIGQYLNAFKGWDGFKQLIGQLLGIAPAMKVVTTETVANTVATQMNDAAKAKQMMTEMGLATATGSLSIAQKEQAATALFNAFTQGQLTLAQANAMLATLGYKVSLDGATWSLKTLDAATKSFMASNPIGWILAIVSVLMTVITLVSQIPSGIKKISESISNLKSEIADIESEIDSLNSELETTQDRMVELLALPTLSFVEQEELENLKRQNAELERQLKLKEMLLENKEDKKVSDTEKYIDKVWNSSGLDKSYYVDENGVIKEDNFWHKGVNTKDALETSMEEYQKLSAKRDSINKVLNNFDQMVADGVGEEEYKEILGAVYGDAFVEANQQMLMDAFDPSNVDTGAWMETLIANRDQYGEIMTDIAAGIGTVLTDENLADLEYGMSEEINTFLDEMYAYQLKWQQTQGGYIKSEAISSMFDDTASKEMQALGKELQAIMDDDSITDKNQAILDTINGLDGAEDASLEIDKLSDSYRRLKTTMDIVGVTAQDIADYFVLDTGAFNSNTVEGIMVQYARGSEVLEKLKNGEKISYAGEDGVAEEIGFEDLFDAKGEVNEIQVSKILKGLDENTREEFSKVIKTVQESKEKLGEEFDFTEAMNHAIKSFNLDGARAVIEFEKKKLEEINIEMFPNLKDEISGIIDTFGELTAAVGSVVDAMDALEQARAEEAYSGSVSLETLEKLMASTDNYADLIEVDETGAIKLATNAQDILAQQKIETIKTNAQLAVTEAQQALMEAEHNEQIYAETTPAQEFLRKSLTKVSGAIAYVSEMWSALTSGDFANAGSRAKAAYDSAISSQEESWENKSTEAATSVAKAKENLANAEKMNKIAQGLTVDNIKSRYDSETASGGNGTKKEVENDLFQKEMDYWENRIAANQSKRDQIQNEIDLLEKQGIRVGQEYYRELIAIEQERKSMLEAQRDEAIKYLRTQEEGSEEWWKAAQIVNDLESEIDDATASIQDFADAQAQIKWDTLEEIVSRFSDLHDEIADLRDILQSEDMFDDDGNWTESGAAVLGTYVQELEAYKNELSTLQSEIADLQAHPYNETNAAYLKETYSIDSEQEYNDLMTQWNEQQREYVKGAYDTADAIQDAYSQQVDAIEDAINEQIDAYNDYIDVVKEAYDAERELYEFKKDIHKQSRSIAETERRIASLSGSTNAADIAERRKLEAQLAEQKESINDSYYNHANEQRSNALDDEARAYEESMNLYIESLRETLEEQAQGLITFTETGTMVTNEFLNGVTATVVQNAGIILEKYEEVSPYMSDKLKQPWIDASAQLGQYGNDLSVLNAWTSDSGYFGKFKITASGQMTTPFINGSAAASTFQTSATNAMNAIANNIRSNVTNITSNLGSVQTAYSGIITTAQRAKAAIEEANAAAAAGAKYTGTSGTTSSASTGVTEVDNRILSKYKVTSDQVLALGYGPITLDKFEDLLRTYQIKYSAKYRQVHNTAADERLLRKVLYGQYVSGPLAVGQYAKGTIGTKRDQWAITDEPGFGDELVLVPGKDGNLSFMRKGTSVVPADITTNLMEWGQFTPDSMNLGGGVNVNMINNAVNKPEFNFAFDALVKAENITEETLPAVKKLVTQELDRFTRELNYALKGKGAR